MGPNNPYSLQKLVKGSVVALKEEGRRELAIMLAQARLFERMDRANDVLVDAAAAVAPSAVTYTLPDRPVRHAELSDIPIVGGWIAAKRLELTGLDRATQLVTILKMGRELQRANVFLNDATDVNALLDAVVAGRIERALAAAGSAGSIDPSTGQCMPSYRGELIDFGGDPS